MNVRDPKIWIALAANALAGFLIVQLNLGLSAFGLAVYVPGLFLPFAMRSLEGPGLIALLFLTGLGIDAVTPVAAGFHAVLLPLLALLGRRVLHRARRDDRLLLVLLSLVANAICFVALTVVFSGNLPGSLNLLGVWLVGLLISEVTLFVFGGWFVLLHDSVLTLVGLPPGREANESGSTV